MHYIISVLVMLAGAAYWFNYIRRGANEVADAANTIQNLPRRLRYRKKAGKRGLELIEEPVEAATVLMISVARFDGTGRVSENQAAKIGALLRENMQLDPEDADDMVIQMRSITQYLTQPDSTLYPMVELLLKSISKDDARELSSMMKDVAETNSEINLDQKELIRRFEERMGILA